MTKEEIKEQVEEVREEELEETNERSEFNIQQFMLDMQMVGDQVRSRELVKPTFHYGDLTISNYLLWLILGELTILNNKLKGGTE